WDSRLAEYPAAQSDSMPHYLSALRHALPSEGRRGYVEWMSQARASFEQSFNIQVHHVPATWICRGAAWERFVTAWIHNAPAWTEVYNRHLAAYRERQGIKSPQHPMPDLHRDPARGIFELPFWITRPSQPRERLLLDASQPQPPIAQLRPRALSFTMFVRLFLADLFIHGIGGALYDQITDAILQELFQTVPPYACVSAAWLLPLGQAYPPEDLSALKWRRHHIEHNPQLAINPFTALRTEVAELITERKHLIENLNASRPQPPARRADPATRHQRRAWFMHLHAINAELHQKDARMLPNLDQQIADADGAMEQNKVLLWREWFFGLHARKSLEQLKAAINGEP
ncbi:MAG TPA: hypothetical protein VHM90_19210, partial [Phycisphaerae bacterium]|nr:hypothetical protein [Phycisphaerae bacterium]